MDEVTAEKPAIANVVVGECTPTEEAEKKILPLIGEILKGFKEAYLLTESVSVAMFNGRIDDGKMMLPPHMRHLFGDEEVAIGVLQFKKPPEPPSKAAEKPAEEV